MKRGMQPAISVLMAVYQEKEAYVRAAVESILGQTFTDFEFLIILDGADGAAAEYIRRKAPEDDRMVILTNKRNLGLTKSLNLGLAKAAGAYIARMDADDVSDSRRLEKQYAFMEKHREIAVAGCHGDAFDGQGRHNILTFCVNNHPGQIRARMLFGNAGVIHSSALIRKEFLERHRITYDESLPKSQDYGLWSDIIHKGGRIYTLHEFLISYRIHGAQISSQYSGQQTMCVRQVQKKQLERILGTVDERQLDLNIQLGFFENRGKVREFDNYIRQLLSAAKTRTFYDYQTLERELMYCWLKCIVCAVRKYHNVSFLKSEYLGKACRPHLLYLAAERALHRKRLSLKYQRYLKRKET